MQNFFKKKKNQETLSQPPEVTFREVDPDLDIFTQARMNLMNFKEYFEATQVNAFDPFQIVAASVSKAFSNLTNKSAELKMEKEKHDKDMKSFDDDTNKQHSDYDMMEKVVAEMKIRYDILKKRNSELKNNLSITSSRVRKRNRAKKRLISINLEYHDLLSTFNDKVESLKCEIKSNQIILDEYNKVKEELEAKQKKSGEELYKTEQRVKELQMRAKKIEQEQEEAKEKAVKVQAKKARKSSSVDKSLDTYVIRDNLNISNKELSSLRSIVSTIQGENKMLTMELESKKMDMECLIQENNGLKQMIRDIVEPE